MADPRLHIVKTTNAKNMRVEVNVDKTQFDLRTAQGINILVPRTLEETISSFAYRQH